MSTMTKRGLRSCLSFCYNCQKDCHCDSCGKCHSCYGYKSTLSYEHSWHHACKGIQHKGIVKLATLDKDEILMVRGKQGCASFCQNCKSDCLCSQCKKCHSCSLSNNNTSGSRGYYYDDMGSSNTGRLCGARNTHTCIDIQTSLQDTPTDPQLALEKVMKSFAGSLSSELDPHNVYIGSDKKRYQLPKEVLKKNSGYFKKLFSSGMKESNDNATILDSEIDTVPAFENFLQYCYFKDYKADLTGEKNSLFQHAAVYVLAERLESLKLKKEALLKANTLCYQVISTSQGLTEEILVLPSIVQLIYENTFDENSGKRPSATDKNFSTVNTAAVPHVDPGALGEAARDGFRVLLAHFAACCLQRLASNEGFIAVHRSYCDFATDMLMFLGQGAKIKINKDRYLEL